VCVDTFINIVMHGIHMYFSGNLQDNSILNSTFLPCLMNRPTDSIRGYKLIILRAQHKDSRAQLIFFII